jgi:hypothetical protein
MARSVVTTLNSRIPELKGQMRQRVSSVVRRTAFNIQGRIRRSFAEPKSGRMYGRHQASAPGEAPAIDTGALTNSIQVAMEGDMTAYVFTNMEHGPGLEYGTRKMAARPFMLPAAEDERPTFEQEMKHLL